MSSGTQHGEAQSGKAVKSSHLLPSSHVCTRVSLAFTSAIFRSSGFLTEQFVNSLQKDPTHPSISYEFPSNLYAFTMKGPLFIIPFHNTHTRTDIQSESTFLLIKLQPKEMKSSTLLAAVQIIMVPPSQKRSLNSYEISKTCPTYHSGLIQVCKVCAYA